MGGFTEVHGRPITLTVMRVLVIASPQLSGFMEAGLADLGHKVRAAANVDEAVLWLDFEVPDVVVFDLDPAIVRSRDRFAATPGWDAPRLVLTTGDPSERADATDLGDEQLHKPFRFEALCRKLDQLNGSRRVVNGQSGTRDNQSGPVATSET